VLSDGSVAELWGTTGEDSFSRTGISMSTTQYAAFNTWMISV